MSNIAIRVENLSKIYKIGASRNRHDTLRDHIMHGVTSLFSRNGHPSAISARQSKDRGQSSNSDYIWALQDVSFEVKHGEVIGFIGRNGAGKSTLLKILSRITEPTTGRAEIFGRVGSLLEVGTGFHPELTGRENVYLNGAVLGMKRWEIEKKFDEIVAFSEIEKFIDTPVKRYSSGMYVRLAFAVAAHLEPEILIVDEVLAVGDAQFQKKCLGKMGDVAKEGRTVLLVTHNMQTISTLTQRSVMLSKGRVSFRGPTSNAIAEYLREGCSEDLFYTDVPSLAEPRITRVELRTSAPGNTQVSGEPMEVQFEITTPVPIKDAALSFQACDAFQRPVLHLWTFDSDRPMCREPGVLKLTCYIPRVRLYMGRYNLTVHFSQGSRGKKIQTLEGICPFEVVMQGQHRTGAWQAGTCLYLEECDWRIRNNSL